MHASILFVPPPGRRNGDPVQWRARRPPPAHGRFPPPPPQRHRRRPHGASAALAFATAWLLTRRRRPTVLDSCMISHRPPLIVGRTQENAILLRIATLVHITTVRRKSAVCAPKTHRLAHVCGANLNHKLNAAAGWVISA
jgi:hypothetical protein